MDMSFDWAALSPEKIVAIWMGFGFGIGMLIHWVSVVGTAARWALNAGS